MDPGGLTVFTCSDRNVEVALDRTYIKEGRKLPYGIRHPVESTLPLLGDEWVATRAFGIKQWRRISRDSLSLISGNRE